MKEATLRTPIPRTVKTQAKVSHREAPEEDAPHEVPVFDPGKLLNKDPRLQELQRYLTSATQESVVQLTNSDAYAPSELAIHFRTVQLDGIATSPDTNRNTPNTADTSNNDEGGA